jgi:hypothetical protein
MIKDRNDDYERMELINGARRLSVDDGSDGGGTDSPDYLPPNGNTGVNGPGTPASYTGGDVRGYIEGLFRSASSSPDRDAGMRLKDQIESTGARLQIASDGTWRGRLNGVPGYGDVDVIEDGKTWGQGNWAWRIPGTPGYSSGGGGGGGSTYTPKPYTPVAPTTPIDTPTRIVNETPVQDPKAVAQAAQTAEDEKMLRDMLTKMAQQGTAVDRNSAEFRQQVDPIAAQQDRARRQYESETAERLSAQGLGASGAMESERRLGMERAGYNTGVFESQLVQQELKARRDEIQFALQGLGGMLSSEQTRDLQLQLKQIDNAMAREMAALEAQLKREQLAQQDRQFGASLEQNDRHFGIDSGIRIGEAEARYAPWIY